HVSLVHVHDAEAGRLRPGHFHDGDGAGGPGGLVALHHLGVVHLVDVVAGQDHHILRVIQVDEPDVLIDGVGGALVPGAALAAHIGRQDVDAAGGAVQVPGHAAADVAVQLQGPVL